MLSQFKKHKSMFIYYSTHLKHERNVLSFGFFLTLKQFKVKYDEVPQLLHVSSKTIISTI